MLDCDVLQADGGTRTASITGAYVALHDAVSWLRERNLLGGEPLRTRWRRFRSAWSAATPMLDLCYTEDSGADVDMNVVMSGAATSSRSRARPRARPFDRDVLDRLLDLGASGCARLTELQQPAGG